MKNNNVVEIFIFVVMIIGVVSCIIWKSLEFGWI